MEHIKTIVIAILIAVLVITFRVGQRRIGDAYVKGFGDAVKFATKELRAASRETIDSCHVVALPVMDDRDTVIYFLSSKFCEDLDTVINDRWKRAN